MDRFARFGDDARRRLRPSPHPDWVGPMLATLTQRHYFDEGWVFERELDDEGCLARSHRLTGRMPRGVEA
jgi:hypothetical protein